MNLEGGTKTALSYIASIATYFWRGICLLRHNRTTLSELVYLYRYGVRERLAIFIALAGTLWRLFSLALGRANH